MSQTPQILIQKFNSIETYIDEGIKKFHRNEFLVADLEDIKKKL